jgi:hypothetical protein
VPRHPALYGQQDFAHVSGSGENMYEVYIFMCYTFFHSLCIEQPERACETTPCYALILSGPLALYTVRARPLALQATRGEAGGPQQQKD